MEPVPADATDFSCAIAEKELLRPPTEIDALLAVAEVEAGAGLDGVEVLLELLELQAAASSATAAAAAVSPARADTEYNGVPRSFTQTCRCGHVRDQIPITRQNRRGLLAEIVGLSRETLPLTHS
jgi:hypothetical protein